MKKILIILLLFLIVSCNNNKYNKDMVKEGFKEASFTPVLEELLPKSLSEEKDSKNKRSNKINTSNLIYDKVTPYMLDDITNISNSSEALKEMAIAYLSMIELDEQWHNIQYGNDTGRARYFEDNRIKVLQLDITKIIYLFGGETETVNTKSMIRIYPDKVVEVISDGLYDGIIYLKNAKGKEFELLYEIEGTLKYGIFNKEISGDYTGLYVIRHQTAQMNSLVINYAYGNDNLYNDLIWQYNFTGESIYTVYQQKENIKTTYIRQGKDNFRNYYEIPLNAVNGIKSIDYNSSSEIFIDPVVTKVTLNDNKEVNQLEGLELKLRNIYSANDDKSGFVLNGVSGIVSNEFYHNNTKDLNNAFTLDIKDKAQKNNLEIDADFTVMNEIDIFMDNVTALGINDLKNNYNAFEIETKKLASGLDFV